MTSRASHTKPEIRADSPPSLSHPTVSNERITSGEMSGFAVKSRPSSKKLSNIDGFRKPSA